LDGGNVESLHVGDEEQEGTVGCSLVGSSSTLGEACFQIGQLDLLSLGEKTILEVQGSGALVKAKSFPANESSNVAVVDQLGEAHVEIDHLVSFLLRERLVLEAQGLGAVVESISTLASDSAEFCG